MTASGINLDILCCRYLFRQKIIGISLFSAIFLEYWA